MVKNVQFGEIGEGKDLAETLIDIKLNDLRLNSSFVPGRANLMDKMFARSLGITGGRMLDLYQFIYGQSWENDVDGTKRQLKREVGRKSKVHFKLPFLDPSNARICGLVAMNYSGFFDSEADIYKALSEDLGEQRFSEEQISENLMRVAERHPQRYGELLERRQQSIYDFEVLMGFHEDKERFQELSENMPGNISKYFSKIAKRHKGNKLGLSWPLSLKKFSRPIVESLSRDSITHSLQEGIGEDYGISKPSTDNYALAFQEVKDLFSSLTSPDTSYLTKWQTARALPANLFFLSGFDAYTTQGAETYTRDEVLNASTTAAIPASTTAGGDDDEDVSAFITTFGAFFSTTL